MGYYMEQTDSYFIIKKENFDACLEAIKGLYQKYVKNEVNGSWVDWHEFEKEDITLEEAFEAWRWRLRFATEYEWANTEEDNVFDIVFEGEKRGDDDIFFNTISPFVEDGSYIQMSGECGAMWRWVFCDGICKEIEPQITWSWI